ncbi:hypothetical protein DRN75_04050 [Nanoarchaeota archaeon]|nr:MAG: hypothetical protein DRN75_04050 [Nanoarchaeota archaeon]
MMDDVLKSKKYKNLDPEVIADVISKYNVSASDKRTREYRQALKAVKRELHKIYAMYNVNHKLIERKLSSFLSGDSSAVFDILNSHVSTRERIPYYREFWDFVLSYKPRTITDLACGLNPFSLALIKPSFEYTAVDVDKKLIGLIDKFLSGINVEHSVRTENILNHHYKSDVILLLKSLTILYKQDSNVFNWLKSLRGKVIVSLPTRSLVSRKPLDNSWIEEKIDFVEKISFPGEDVYVLA